MNEYQLYINGKYKSAYSGKIVDSINPATGSVYARVHQAEATDAAQALDIAWDAFQSWKSARPCEREAVFLKAAQIIEARREELKDILIDEAGSTVVKANTEVSHTVQHTLSMAGECRRVAGENYWSDLPGVESYSIRRPLGLILAISPFNFPLLLSNKKIGWALAAGNAVILKPSEVTPVVGLKLGEIYTEAGLPNGVLNVLPAQGADLGDSIISDPRVKKVAFTGSSRVGKSIAALCAQHHTKYTLELGGKNPLIVLADAELDYAVKVAAFSNFMHQGQVCMSGSRVIVEETVYEEFVDKFTQKVSAIKHGDPREPGVMVGPLIRDEQPAFVQRHVDNAVTNGARLMTGGTYENNYYKPTVLADVTPDMDIFRIECFGPVASVIKAKDHVHALELANDTQYGLSAAVVTNDLQKSMFMVEGLESGMVHINGPTIRDEPGIPFGGIKDSGSGREGGKFSMDDFTELKWVTIQRGQQQFPF